MVKDNTIQGTMRLLKEQVFELAGDLNNQSFSSTHEQMKAVVKAGKCAQAWLDLISVKVDSDILLGN